MKVALVHDWLNQWGGAERVLEVLHEMYPQAPVYTSIYYPRALPPTYQDWDIRPSFMQRWPWVKRHHQPFLPFYPLAVESYDLSPYDLVISSSSAFCHGVLTRPETCHICYCHTPPRFIWNLPQYLRRERVNPLARRLLPLVVNYLRAWDVAASQRVDYYIANSKTTAARIRKFYRREAAVVHPPVDIQRFSLGEPVEDYFLVVSRLVPYKRVDIAVKAFNKLGLPLVIVGEGRDKRALKAMAGAKVRFLGHLSPEEVVRVMGRCRAFIFPGEEDFGIAPVEAQAAGRPVIAYGAGGSLETVVEGVTGHLFYEQTPEALAGVVAQFKDGAFDPEAIRRHAQGFDTQVFRARLEAFISEKVSEYGQGGVSRR